MGKLAYFYQIMKSFFHILILLAVFALSAEILLKSTASIRTETIADAPDCDDQDDSQDDQEEEDTQEKELKVKDWCIRPEVVMAQIELNQEQQELYTRFTDMIGFQLIDLPFSPPELL